MGNDTISESHNILDAQGRTRIFYTYHHQWKEMSLYKEIEYPNDTTFVASRIMDYKADRAAKGYIYIEEENWSAPLLQNRIESKVNVRHEPLQKMNTENFAELFDKIRKDEYENKPEWHTKFEVNYLSPMRRQRIITSYNIRGKIDSYLQIRKYDEIGRQTEQIDYMPNDSINIEKIYYKSYDPNYYDF